MRDHASLSRGPREDLTRGGGGGCLVEGVLGWGSVTVSVCVVDPEGGTSLVIF